MTARRNPEDAARRRRAAASLTGLLLVVLLAACALGVLVFHRPATRPPGGQPIPPRPSHETTTPGVWDIAAENALAQRPMLQLPVQEAMQQPLSAGPAGDPLTVPSPHDTQNRWIPGGFPPTPEGAVGQLQALTEQALAGADPAVTDRAERELSEPGAPDPASSTPTNAAASLRSAARLPDTGAVPGLVAHYKVTDGLVKGTSDNGRFVVACVLGELSADYQGRSGNAGLGVCEAMRWVDGQWRIAPTVRAAPATNAWPGSDAAVRAGYRELRYA